MLPMQDVKEKRPITTVVDGYPIYAYGQFDIYSVSPTYFDNLPIQRGNDSSMRKIKPKKSWEISSNFIGLTPTRLPSCRAKEIEPHLPVFFIDGNPNTVGFAGVPQGNPAHTFSWVRIDLSKETRVASVALLPQESLVGFPTSFAIRLSRWNLWHTESEWKTVFSASGEEVPEEQTLQIFSFEPTLAREVWITSPADFYLAEIEVRDESGENVALASKGAGVTVSAGTHLFWLDERTQTDIWPLIYDLGLKWVRVNYHLTPLTWQFVEREKGRYVIDPYTDRIISETVDCGVEIVLTLGAHTHPLYPHDEEAAAGEKEIEGFCNYVRFMVNHFKDRIRYFEIFNEFYNQDSYGPGVSGPYRKVAEYYASFAIPAARLIKEIHPEAKVVLGGPCPVAADFIEAVLKTGMAELLDVISWHPYQLNFPPEAIDRPRHPWAGPELSSYTDLVRHVQKIAASYGFNGEYHANEAGAYAIHRMRSSPLVSAKYLARSVLLHSAMEIPTFWNETVSLFRPAWQPFFTPSMPHIKPDYSYYLLRTLCTVMDGAKPTEVPFEVICNTSAMEKHSFLYQNGDILLALWISEEGREEHPKILADVRLHGIKFRQAVGVELMNGFEQELDCTFEDGGARISDLIVRDYPLLIHLLRK